MKTYDLILVYWFSRVHHYYANIIKALSSEYRIGLLLSDEDNFYASRKSFRVSKQTDKQFRSLCVQFGADLIYVNEKVKGRIVILPVVGGVSTEDYLSKFRGNVSWDKPIGMFFFSGSGGIGGLKNIMDMGVDKFIVPAKDILAKRINHDGQIKEIENLDIIEMGFPYKKYPVFDNLNIDIDFLVAYPSHTHFKPGKEKDKYAFVNELYKLLKRIDTSNKIYLKRHSNSDKSQFFSSLDGGPLWFLKVAGFVASILSTLSPVYKRKLYRIAIKLKNSLIARKYPSLEEVTQYHNLGIELFLPHVRQGLITGNSATQFHALYSELAIYNCDPQEKDEIAALPYSAAYIVPFCNGDLAFDRSNFNRISNECKNADIIQLIRDELK
ncbi:MAG: hypothetical protein HOI47_16340, partial [Candidatus Scalindua sp.]|nr:hypothetical protein [Candidatus Scalindua sp.]